MIFSLTFFSFKKSVKLSKINFIKLLTFQEKCVYYRYNINERYVKLAWKNRLRLDLENEVKHRNATERTKQI